MLMIRLSTGTMFNVLELPRDLIPRGMFAADGAPGLTVFLAFFATLLGVIRVTSGSLSPVLAAHIAFNGVPMAAALSRIELPEVRAAQTLFSLIVVGVLLAGFVLLVRRSPAAAESREQEAQVPTWETTNHAI